MLQKSDLRNKIATQKKSFSTEELAVFSSEVMATLESTDLFQQTQTILAYYSMDDEVDTHGLIHKYEGIKRFILPVVAGNDLMLREFSSEADMKTSSFGILEPIGRNVEDTNEIDLILVPGVAFDRKLNRLGRGRDFTTGCCRR